MSAWFGGTSGISTSWAWGREIHLSDLFYYLVELLHHLQGVEPLRLILEKHIVQYQVGDVSGEWIKGLPGLAEVLVHIVHCEQSFYAFVKGSLESAPAKFLILCFQDPFLKIFLHTV